MKKYSVKVYHPVERFQDEYTVYATTKAHALSILSLETDYTENDFEVLEIKEIE